ncbi:hypothetical protein [Methanococcus maripaludis]|uniref:Uncharacterized protein (UPF0333 family) n=1 Tax=Methanococcus maripaludis TaxID=39152 RepID=A0A7J9PUI5_METMI|nr:hypothetical protein [Methanococcus maripaludis]MBA2869197.1 uncharacterized protein (UPF0333 family) [Methanococcus maripaludis]
MLPLPSNKKGQVSFDFIIAMLFLLLIFAFMGQNVLNMAKSFRDSETAEHAHAILDSFENYAIIAYSKDITINATFEPIGNLNYTIMLSNKSISVNSSTNIIFQPETDANGDYVSIKCNNVDNSVNTIPLNAVRISFGDFTVSKDEMEVNIR